MSSQPSYIAEPPKQVSLPNDGGRGGSNPKKDIILGLGFLLDDPSIYMRYLLTTSTAALFLQFIWDYYC